MPEAPPKRASSRVETVMRNTKQVSVSYGFIARCVLKVPTFMPLLFVAPAVMIGDGEDLSNGVADVLGSGSEILLILTLMVTPVALLTGWRWIVPMRRWYGVMFGLSAVSDAIIASITTTDFAGGPIGRIAGHTFLFTGLLMVTILIPLILTGNNRAMRYLGKYWKILHKLMYVVWGLLVVHLALLDGFGIPRDGDGIPILHQRLYQIVAVSIPLVILRIPRVVKWVNGMKSDGRQREMWLVLAPLLAIFLVGYLFIEHEFTTKGIALFLLSPVTD